MLFSDVFVSPMIELVVSHLLGATVRYFLFLWQATGWCLRKRLRSRDQPHRTNLNRWTSYISRGSILSRRSCLSEINAKTSVRLYKGRKFG